MRCVRLNGDLAVLPLAVPLDGSFTSLKPHTKEDFQKMLTEWQEHLGSIQVSDRAVSFFNGRKGEHQGETHFKPTSFFYEEREVYGVTSVYLYPANDF
jgi:hypothetical protein